jgi:ribosome biogenesis GTPase / thiamine phosphate phosphatase
MQGMILRAQGGIFWVQCPDGVRACTLRGRLRLEHAGDSAVIGDRVELEPTEAGHGVIAAVLPRTTKLSRRQPSGHDRGVAAEDVIVANLERLFVVFACAQPRPNPRLIDRFLVVAAHSKLEAVLVANKADLVTADERAQIFGPYARIGYRVQYVSAQSGEGVAELRALLGGQIAALVGPSGVGKSSLLNAIEPGLGLRTGAVSSALNKGRHTTVGAQLLPCAGGYVADTPGIRELGLWQLPPDELPWCFPEMRPLLGQCTFAGCSHLHEPGCAVRAAVAAGEISAARYDSYQRLRAGEATGGATETSKAAEPARAATKRSGQQQRRSDEYDWDEWDDAPEYEAMRGRKGHAPQEAARRAEGRAWGRMAKKVMQDKRRSRG